VKWIQLDQNTTQWWVFVNTLIIVVIIFIVITIFNQKQHEMQSRPKFLSSLIVRLFRRKQINSISRIMWKRCKHVSLYDLKFVTHFEYLRHSYSAVTSLIVGWIMRRE
jgi:uncharacterized membrane protein